MVLWDYSEWDGNQLKGNEMFGQVVYNGHVWDWEPHWFRDGVVTLSRLIRVKAHSRGCRWRQARCRWIHIEVPASKLDATNN